MKIGVLLANNDDADFARRHPDDARKVAALLSALRPAWNYESVAVKDGVFPAAPGDFDGYVITGSPASVNELHPWIRRLEAFIVELEAARVPTVGLCFGHQAIAKALGGVVSANRDGWGLGTGETVFERFESWMEPPQKSLVLHAAHNEQVIVPPAQARVLGGSAHCPIGSFCIGRHIFTTEFHPEITGEFMCALLDHLSDHLDVATIARARASLERPVDSALFARWMVAFFEQGAARGGA